MWRYIAARARGSSHARSGTPCQDQLACDVLEDGTLVAVLADGAGSASEAELGARIATGAVLEAARRELAAGAPDLASTLRRAILSAREAVLEEARAAGQPARAFASTLLAVALGPAGGAAAQLGDGLIVVDGAGSGWSWVFWPQRGEFANTTYFLTDDEAEQTLKVEALAAPVSSVALMSDGLEPLALHYQSRAAHAPFFDGMFRVLGGATGAREVVDLSAALQRYLESETVSSRTDDDVSLVLARRVGTAP